MAARAAVTHGALSGAYLYNVVQAMLAKGKGLFGPTADGGCMREDV